MNKMRGRVQTTPRGRYCERVPNLTAPSKIYTDLNIKELPFSWKPTNVVVLMQRFSGVSRLATLKKILVEVNSFVMPIKPIR